MGVAIVIGRDRSAQNVKIQDVATTTDFENANARTRPSTEAQAAANSPVAHSPATKARQPKLVEHSRTGRTAFARTLAFFARS